MGSKLQGTVLVVCVKKPPNKRMSDRKEQKTITRPELNAMAKERGMKDYPKLKKFQLAERLGIELPKRRRRRRGGRRRRKGKAEKGT